LAILTLNGKVVSGQGSGRKYIALPWVFSQIKEKLGFAPYLGTLNLQLTSDSIRCKGQLEKAKSAEIRPAEGYCAGLVIKAFVGDLDCAIVLPQVEGYSKSLLELIAPVNLREALCLKDGDKVSVAVRL
jgi:riboflavin kinase